MTLNEQLLRAELDSLNMRIKDYAVYLGISPVTLYRKLSGESDFDRKEILKSQNSSANASLTSFFCRKCNANTTPNPHQLRKEDPIMPIRMRFAAQALEELRKEDPETPVSLHYIRALAASGKIPVVRAGGAGLSITTPCWTTWRIPQRKRLSTEKSAGSAAKTLNFAPQKKRRKKECILNPATTTTER